MDFVDWADWAEKQRLFITIWEVDALCCGEEIAVVPLERIYFALALDQRGDYGFECEALDFFRGHVLPLCRRTALYYTRMIYKVGDVGEEKTKGKGEWIDRQIPEIIGEVAKQRQVFYSVRVNQHLELGTGREYTRFISWERLQKLKEVPKIRI